MVVSSVNSLSDMDNEKTVQEFPLTKYFGAGDRRLGRRSASNSTENVYVGIYEHISCRWRAEAGKPTAKEVCMYLQVPTLVLENCEFC